MSVALSEYVNDKSNNFNLIRFVAASLVLYSHSYAIAIGTGQAEPLRKLIGMTWGTMSVDVFFVISGFLVASSFFKRNNVLSFVWARVLRIYPALIVAVLFCVFVVGLTFTTKSPLDFLTHPWTYKFFIKNITLFSGIDIYLPGAFHDVPFKYYVNGSLWTLPIEVKMYALLALVGTALIWLQNKVSLKLAKAMILSVAVIAILVNVVNNFQPFMPSEFIHLFSMFFVGTAFYVCRDNISLSINKFVILLVVVLISTVYKEFFFVVYCVFLPYLVLYVAYVPSGIIRNFNKVGDYSYGIYIYAFPVQQSVAALIPNVSVPSMILISFVFTFILAFLSWHVVEKKFLAFKSNSIHIDKAVSRMRLSITSVLKK